MEYELWSTRSVFTFVSIFMTHAVMWAGAFFLTALVHELGHALVGWLLGFRKPAIYFGAPSDPRLLSLTFLPIPIHFHLGPRIMFVPPRIMFAVADWNLSQARNALMAAGGPLANALLLTISPIRTEFIRLLHDIAELRFFWPPTFSRAVAAWTLFGLVVPLIPKHYHSVGSDSDGLVILRFFSSLFRKS